MEITLKATERERFQLEYEKSELERIIFEKANIVKGFVLNVLHEKQMMSDLLETETALRFAETERVRELEMCVMAKQEEFAKVASNALAQLRANEVTISDLQCELEQLKCLNASSTSRLETQLITIERLKAEKEQLEAESYNARAVSLAVLCWSRRLGCCVVPVPARCLASCCLFPAGAALAGLPVLTVGWLGVVCAPRPGLSR